ncbi:MAG: MmcQ/YjbR family DNA-binding protein [Eggerthellaceae bacterium]|nr:MmcQ/YjbR family DNA-binding protein [Eggerthellaceae bacterium]
MSIAIGDVPDGLLLELLDASYRLTQGKRR